jgi:2-keto-4-pentenoate hydratase/2-oxohepta-3-ene-1,7-dioic acid hydratase in catechol pathway
VLKIGRLGKNIAPEFAHRYYTEIGIGIDFTARDLQDDLRSKGLPWEKSKAFDTSAAVSKTFLPIAQLDKKNIEFRLDINGQTVQSGNSSHMIYDFDTIVAHVSNYFTLKIGDLIYTGTPAGVGPVKIGDRLEAYIDNQKLMDFQIK